MIGRRRHDKAPAAPAVAPSEQELQITHGLESLRDATARELMTPRVDVVALGAPVRFGDVADAVRRSGHSHFPVYEENLDHLIGVLFVKDLFHIHGTGASESERQDRGLPLSLDVTGRLRDPHIVPESRSALEVLADMRRRRRGFAIVVDEYGGFAGVITIKDLVSELVGDLHDEFDRASGPTVLRIDGNRYLVDGACDVDEVREQVGVAIPDGEYVTLGGYLFDAFGHVPNEGETVTIGDATFQVTHMDRRRIAKVVIEVASTTLSPGDGESHTANGK